MLEISYASNKTRVQGAAIFDTPLQMLCRFSVMQLQQMLYMLQEYFIKVAGWRGKYELLSMTNDELFAPGRKLLERFHPQLGH